MKNNIFVAYATNGTFFKNPNTQLFEAKSNNHNDTNKNYSNNNLTTANSSNTTISVKEKDFALNNLNVNSSGRQSLLVNSNPNTENKGSIMTSMLKQNLVFLNKKGSSNTFPNPNIIGYTYIKGSESDNNFDIASVYKILFKFFKSMYCLISKPVFIITSDVIKIQLFYFVCLPSLGLELNNTHSSKKKINSLKKKAKVTENAKEKIKAKVVVDSEPSVLEKESGYKNKNLRIRQSLFKVKNFKVKERLINLAKNKLIEVYPKKFEIISNKLSRFFNKSVEFELIRLHQPYLDSNILVNFLALLINKKNISVVIHRFFNRLCLKKIINKPLSEGLKTKNQSDKAYLSGLNIKISGRLMREPIIPRITTKKFEKGFTAKGKINYFDIARLTHKNRKGAFTITVKSGQKF